MRYYGICRYYVDDEEVVADNELQELVNELSADGKHGDFGGLGMVRRSSESIILFIIKEACTFKEQSGTASFQIVLNKM